jgi:hypothetical protein
MKTDRELMQQALDALKIAEEDGNCYYEATELLRTRLAQPEREPDDIASILACRDMLDAQPVPPRTWVGSGDIENSNAYLTPPQRTEPPQKKVWTFWDLSGGDITDAIKAKIKEKNGGHSAS